MISSMALVSLYPFGYRDAPSIVKVATILRLGILKAAMKKMKM